MRRLGQRLVDLFAHPQGWAAGPMALVLNTVNHRANDVVAEVLGVGGGDRVLEVGFGGGAAIPATLRRLGPDGVLYAVDLSPDMVLRASSAFRGEPRLACADVAALPIRSASVDRAYAVHSHLYWPSLRDGLEELRRVLRPDGRLLLGMDLVGIRLVEWFGPAYAPTGPDDLAPVLAEAGFADVRKRRLAATTWCVTAVRP